MASKQDLGIRDAATFWHGLPLSALDVACLLSFVQQGFRVTVYSYDAISDLPSGLRSDNASKIISKDFLHSFIVMGKPSLSHFSDIFRYELFSKTGEVWIDTDLFCLQDFKVPQHGNFLTKETAAGLNGAILRLDSSLLALQAILADARSYAQRPNFKWGSTGPTLITQHFGSEAIDEALEPYCFYPIHWNDWWMPFLPASCARCERACQKTLALHLWNNILVKSGYWKDIAPPAGSYLNKRLNDRGLLQLFKEVMPEQVMIQLVENYIEARSGASLRMSEMSRTIFQRLIAKVRYPTGR